MVVEPAQSRGGLFTKGSFLFVTRSQELHLRTEAHSYLSDLTKPSDLEFIESKRPRLDLLQDPLMRHSPLLNQSQQGGSEDLSKVRGHGASWMWRSLFWDPLGLCRAFFEA